MNAPLSEPCAPVETIYAALSEVDLDAVITQLRRCGVDAHGRRERFDGIFGPVAVDVVTVSDDTGAGWVLDRAACNRGTWAGRWVDAEHKAVTPTIFGRGLVRGRQLALALLSTRKVPG